MAKDTPRPDPLTVRQPKQARSKARLEAILDAAEGLIAVDGMAHLTMSNVASRAKISIGSLYQYVPTPQALLRALADRFLSEWRRDIERFMSRATTPQELSDAIAHILWRIYGTMKERPQLREIWAHMQADRELAALDLEDSRRNVDWIVDAMVRVGAVDDDDRARVVADVLLITHLSGSAIQMATGLDDDEGTQIVRAYVETSAARAGLPAPSSFPPVGSAT
ncbi:Transcriptional regulator, TetR family [Candidatus Phaeomarinobacter ectocarpi]|uniref:Transcriptional regulator, TetR family n=1 Tax=Candidatus Phaeomarinibacter ectocarpi TaxID=1458461 RepID=X5MCG7_9HYPH|nr:TetR/AcrR family transcriptional regulator [Candidatus Phaeomarinobacter ectocarpi]CDO59172.1 Transcriptional regulator, TetR family [Candidatus Phaeomarinobacter ectocarpi]